MRHHAAFGASACSGGIYDAGGVTAFAWGQCCFALAAKFLPALRACQLGVGGSFSYQNGLHIYRSASCRNAELAPDRIFRDKHSCAGVFEKLPLLIRREFVIKRDQHPAREENSISRDQPLRLIRHDDAGAVTRGEAGILQSFRQWMRTFSEIAIGEPLFLPLAVGFD